jgi:hypothetical protein
MSYSDDQEEEKDLNSLGEPAADEFSDEEDEDEEESETEPEEERDF